MPYVNMTGDPDDPDWQYVPMIERPEDLVEEPLPSADPAAVTAMWDGYFATLGITDPNEEMKD